ncbi:MAG TPA: alcohol dehydrogenase catalytic domain-containing protein, partial [Anaerolineaceae bacterium]
YERGHPTIIKKVPSTFGHEFSGEVIEVGEGVTRFQPGMRVASCNSAPCRQCYYCRRGDFNLCEDLLLLNGAYAEYIVIPARLVNTNVYELPAHMTYAEASISEPLGTAVHAIRRSRIEPGDTVGVLGSGPLGLMLARLAHLKGARVILSGEITAERERVTRNFGVNEFIDILQVKDAAERIEIMKGMTEGRRGVDVAIEATGFASAWAEAVEMVRKAGTVVFHGGPKAGSTITVDCQQQHYGEHTLIGVYHETPDDYRRGFELLSSRVIDGRQFITDTLPLNQLLEAFQKVRRFEGIKFAMDPARME